MVTKVVEVKPINSAQPLPPTPGHQLVLEGVPWRTYTQLLRLFDDRHLRLTYDQGTLEIMSPLPIHELYKKLIDRLVSTLVEELDWNMASYGSTTFKSRKRERGLEPDECYWVQNEPAVRGQDILDLSKVPPPDLAIEIDITNSSVDRMGIYATLGVPEVWRYDGQMLTVHLLNAEGGYTSGQRSRAFPFLDLNEVTRFLDLDRGISETNRVRQFRAWVRERIAANWQ